MVSQKVTPKCANKASCMSFECHTSTQYFKLLLDIPLIKYSIYDVVLGHG